MRGAAAVADGADGGGVSVVEGELAARRVHLEDVAVEDGEPSTWNLNRGWSVSHASSEPLGSSTTWYEPAARARCFGLSCRNLRLLMCISWIVSP